MTNILFRSSRLVLAATVPAWLLAVPVIAQENKAPAVERAAERAAPAPAPAPASGGGSSGASGGGGARMGGSDGGGRHSSGGGSNGASGERGTGGGARWGAERSGSGGSRATGGGGSGTGTTATGSGTARTSGSSGERGRQNPRGDAATGRTDSDGVPAYARPREGQPVVGTAAPRTSAPPTRGGGGGVIIPGGYYGGYYDPWWYDGGYGYGGGSYGGYYDPWYGAYPSYPQESGSYYDEGALRLKIKPSDAEVYVDGYYVGIVDEFDGIFQRLHLESGPHRIEVRAPGFEPLTFEVRITPDHRTTYQGEMKRIP